jgi:hypothetical protein
MRVRHPRRVRSVFPDSAIGIIRLSGVNERATMKSDCGSCLPAKGLEGEFPILCAGKKDRWISDARIARRLTRAIPPPQTRGPAWYGENGRTRFG